jgi:hypothetical protein
MKEEWTIENTDGADDGQCSISFSPQLEDEIKPIMVEAYGIKYLQGQRIVTTEGLIRITFYPDADDRERVERNMKEYYWQKHRVSTDN